MSAAALARTPLSREGLTFWEDLIVQCERYTAAVNNAVAAQGLGSYHFLECRHDHELHVHKSAPPSTSIRLAIEFLSWGPVIRGTATRQESMNSEYYGEQWEVPIAMDLDGAVVAIFDEGRSFSPQDLARFVFQTFRRCYPAVSLPCECLPLD